MAISCLGLVMLVRAEVLQTPCTNEARCLKAGHAGLSLLQRGSHRHKSMILKSCLDEKADNITVTFGWSATNKKCVPKIGMICSSDTGNRGNRVNTDYTWAGDSFAITSNGKEVCARRTNYAGGWGMNLQILSVQGAVVIIGSSATNKKCVTKIGMTCSLDAGNRGIRVNPDYTWADNRFTIISNSAQVCARRTDYPGGWGLNLQILCVQAQPAGGGAACARPKTGVQAPSNNTPNSIAMAMASWIHIVWMTGTNGASYVRPPAAATPGHMADARPPTFPAHLERIGQPRRC